LRRLLRLVALLLTLVDTEFIDSQPAAISSSHPRQQGQLLSCSSSLAVVAVVLVRLPVPLVVLGARIGTRHLLAHLLGHTR
jgi:hypothetical protein